MVVYGMVDAAGQRFGCKCVIESSAAPAGTAPSLSEESDADRGLAGKTEIKMEGIVGRGECTWLLSAQQFGKKGGE